MTSVRTPIITLLLLASCTCLGQNTFFEFIPGWRALHGLERPDGYRVLGMQWNPSEFSNSSLNSELEPSGSVLNTFQFQYDEDTVSTLFLEYTNSTITYNGSEWTVNSATQSSTEKKIGVLIEWNSELSDTLFTKRIDLDRTTLMRSIDSFDDSTFIVTAGVQNSQLHVFASLLNLDSLGTEIWRQDYYCDSYPVDDCRLDPVHTLQCPDGGYLLTCREIYTGQSCDNPIWSILIRTDALGNELWRIKPGPHEEYYVVPGWPVLLDNGHALFFWTDPKYDPTPSSPPSGCWQINDTASIHWQEIDLDDGSVENEGTFQENLPTSVTDTTVHSYYVTQAQRLDDGNILVSGYDLGELFLMKLDQSMNMIWYQSHIHPSTGGVIDTPMRSYLYGVTPTSDGGYLGVGEFRAWPGGEVWPDGIQTAFAIKLDACGQLDTTGCDPLGLEEFDTSAPLSDRVLRLYPNPASDIVRVMLPSRLSLDVRNGGRAGVEVEVIDITGKVVLEMSGMDSGPSRLHLPAVDEPQGPEIQIDVSSVPAGLYSVLLRSTSGALYSGKVVVE